MAGLMLTLSWWYPLQVAQLGEACSLLGTASFGAPGGNVAAMAQQLSAARMMVGQYMMEYGCCYQRDLIGEHMACCHMALAPTRLLGAAGRQLDRLHMHISICSILMHCQSHTMA